jgi:hypothetical protein
VPHSAACTCKIQYTRDGEGLVPKYTADMYVKFVSAILLLNLGTKRPLRFSECRISRRVSPNWPMTLHLARQFSPILWLRCPDKAVAHLKFMLGRTGGTIIRNGAAERPAALSPPSCPCISQMHTGLHSRRRVRFSSLSQHAGDQGKGMRHS